MRGVDIVDLEPQRDAVRDGVRLLLQEDREPFPSFSATVRVSGTSNSTVRPSVDTHQLRDRSRLPTGRLR
jgi:hypothetical protein